MLALLSRVIYLVAGIIVASFVVRALPTEAVGSVANIAQVILALLNGAGAVVFAYGKDSADDVMRRAVSLPEQLASAIAKKVSSWKNLRYIDCVFGAALLALALVLTSSTKATELGIPVAGEPVLAWKLAVGAVSLSQLAVSLRRRTNLTAIEREIDLLVKRFDQRQRSLKAMTSYTTRSSAEVVTDTIPV